MPYSNYSREACVNTLGQMMPLLGRRQWLFRNRYRDKCIDKIKADCSSAASSMKSLDMQRYIATSAPLHCVDGWDYLGKAILCYSVGDVDTAKHFAYYSELRAVMSILAAEGIGIFNKKNFTIDDAGLHGPINGRGTHEDAYIAFHAWAQSADSGRLLEEIIRPKGLAIKDWLVEITGSTSSPLSWVAADWLKGWGYDLQKLKEDRDVRNEVSYRPRGLDLRFDSVDVQKVSHVVCSIWEALTPVGRGGHEIDLILLKRVLNAYEKGALGRSIPREELKKKIQKLSFSSGETAFLLAALSGAENKINGHFILKNAGCKSDYQNSEYQIHMLSRATLLLRIATGSSMRLMEKTGIHKDDIRFWWEPLGLNHGLWDCTVTDPLLDMWSAVSQAITNVKSINSPLSVATWSDQYAKDILALSGCERIGLSGICL